MKPSIIFSLIFLCILVRCKSPVNKDIFEDDLINFKRAEVQLIDSLGTISILLPTRYDTNFMWIHESDCGKPCDKQKYRFQPKALPIFEENGFMYDKPTDSVESFTIVHSMEHYDHPDDSAMIFGRHSSHIQNLLFRYPKSKLAFDTVQKIGDRYFSIMAIENPDSIISKKLAAVTTLKSNEIFFYFDLLTGKNDSICKNFIKTSMTSLKSFQIKKIPK